MKNQTCLHFGVSKISLDNPSGEFNPERIILKPFNKIFIFKVKHYWLVWILRKGKSFLHFQFFFQEGLSLQPKVLSSVDFLLKEMAFPQGAIVAFAECNEVFHFYICTRDFKNVKWNPTTKFTTVFDRHGLQQLLSWCILHW